MFQQRPPSEDEISRLPLDFVLLESEFDREIFTDQLISIWIALAESGSLATLPPVPDIVGFAQECLAFFLIYHTNTCILKSPPGAAPDFSTDPEPSTSARGSPSKGDKRWHPYPRPPRLNRSSNAHADYLDEEPPKHPTLDSSDTRDVIGCVYLSLSSATQNTVDIGIALRPDARGRGYGRAALTKVMRYAFETLKMHRVVANAFGPSPSQASATAKATAKEAGTVRWVFEKLGFTHEGVNRRAGFSATDGTWRDVYVLAMLDTDWMLLQGRTTGRASVLTPWDTLMERHEKEREEMTEWMEDPNWGRLRRVGSSDTIRGAAEPDPDDDVVVEDTNDAGMEDMPPNNNGGPSQPIYTDDDLGPAADSYFDTDSWVTDEEPDSPLLGSQVSGPPAPASSIGISPPGSVLSLPSDFEWRSVGESSQPSVISAPASEFESYASWSQVSPHPPVDIRAFSPPIFSLDSDDEDPINAWLSDSEPDVDGPGPQDGALGFLIRQRRGHSN
ncbi:hypothetical protein FRC06_005594 [Ceratobasidium sp. 370]|nr:hypothetical protein FRC06_005594 [Ceratobasidium sp. 370]